MQKFLLITAMLIYMSAQAQTQYKDSGAHISPPMVYVEGGTFVMGNDSQKTDRPAHRVTLNDFYIGKYEVTQKLWLQVMRNNPSANKGCADCPVESVSKKMIEAFLEKINFLTGKRYRLPTEAEWEYAASGGKSSKHYQFSGSNVPQEVAWYKPNGEGKTHPVGQKKANELGIYDMSGNVWERCSDWYDAEYYKKSPIANPRNDKKASHGVVRGGSWRSEIERCYNRARNRDVYDHLHIRNSGFRLALDK